MALVQDQEFMPVHPHFIERACIPGKPAEYLLRNTCVDVFQSLFYWCISIRGVSAGRILFCGMKSVNRLILNLREQIFPFNCRCDFAAYIVYYYVNFRIVTYYFSQTFDFCRIAFWFMHILYCENPPSLRINDHKPTIAEWFSFSTLTSRGAVLPFWMDNCPNRTSQGLFHCHPLTSQELCLGSPPQI